MTIHKVKKLSKTLEVVQLKQWYNNLMDYVPAFCNYNNRQSRKFFKALNIIEIELRNRGVNNL